MFCWGAEKCNRNSHEGIVLPSPETLNRIDFTVKIWENKAKVACFLDHLLMESNVSCCVKGLESILFA